LRDTFAAGLLRFFQQLFWYFDRNFPRRVHDHHSTILDTSIKYGIFLACL
jgi:hypothetical protein